VTEPASTARVRELLDEARAGRRGALARLVTLVERGGADARAVGQVTHAAGGNAYVVGLTGAPGAGKSTLTNALSGVIREGGDRVGVLAIDPSSPFTGGAILGDRVRMGDRTLDDGVFIRSMATRGHLGGLALATPQAVRVLDAAGLPWIVVETVGVGQVEVDVVGTADTVVVVVNPGWGDAIQANKAGLMEIADVFVVNKADRPGARETERDLRNMLAMSDRSWEPPIVRTVASDGTGAREVLDAVLAHRSHAEASGELARRRAERTRSELAHLVTARLAERARAAIAADGFESLVAAVEERRLDPWTATDRLLGEA
jgi:LAO/AO transport system kinase